MFLNTGKSAVYGPSITINGWYIGEGYFTVYKRKSDPSFYKLN